MTASLIYFSGDFHERVLPFYRKSAFVPAGHSRFPAFAIAIYVLLQILIPLRFLLYPDRLFWNEEGYRFSWRVMLMEKSGVAYFTVKDKITHGAYVVDNKQYLTNLQEKMMSTQPDLILKYAAYLHDEYKKKGINDPEVYGEIYVSLNGQRSKLFIDTTVNLAQQQLQWRHYKWILPYNR